MTIRHNSGSDDEIDDGLSDDFSEELNRVRQRLESMKLPALHVSNDVVRRTIKVLRSRDLPYRGLHHAWEDGCLDVSVSAGSITRTGLILESLMRALRACGYIVETGGRIRNKQTSVQILGQKITFRVREKLKQIKLESSDRGYPHIDHEPTGRLVLEIMH